MVSLLQIQDFKRIQLFVPTKISSQASESKDLCLHRVAVDVRGLQSQPCEEKITLISQQ